MILLSCPWSGNCGCSGHSNAISLSNKLFFEFLRCKLSLFSRLRWFIIFLPGVSRCVIGQSQKLRSWLTLSFLRRVARFSPKGGGFCVYWIDLLNLTRETFQKHSLFFSELKLAAALGSSLPPHLTTRLSVLILADCIVLEHFSVCWSS